VSRINARIDDALARQLDEIREITSESTTEALRSAIALYRASLGERGRRAADVFAATGFIGSGSGRADLSTTYKAELTRSLEAKIRPAKARKTR
jgi:hypothetical protein